MKASSSGDGTAALQRRSLPRLAGNSGAIHRALLAVTVVSLLAAVTVTSWFASSASRQMTISDAPLPSKPPNPTSPAATTHAVKDRWSRYAGSETCGQCHAEIAAHYQRSGMSQTWRDLTAATSISLEWSGEVSDPQSGYRYRLLHDEQGYRQEESLLDEPSPHRLERAARYQIGSGKHAAAFAAEHNGYLTQLPLAWFAENKSWGLNPGYELRNQRFDRPITAGCVACHGGQADPDLPAANRYHGPIAGGIGCERCHGPGEAHVRYHRDGFAQEVTTAMVHPGRLDAERGNDICLQCHLQGDGALYHDGADAFSFRPGDRLRDHRIDYEARTDRRPALSVASHGAALVSSRCFQSSQRLTCFDCHDPHRPVEDFTAQWFDTRCLHCHTEQSCGRARIATPGASASCTHCHMPKRFTREGPHLATTDHWIRVVEGNDETKRADPVLPPNSEVELHDLTGGEDRENGLAGAAYVLLHETMGPQRPSVDRGIGLLEERLEQAPRDLQARYWLASGYIARHRASEAIELLTPLVAAEPHRHDARFRLAIAHDQAKQYDAAIEHYQRLVQEAPQWLEPYPLLARLYLYRGRTADAERLLKQQLNWQPDDEAWAGLALARHLQQAPRDECLKLIDRALSLDPRSIPALLNRGYINLAVGDAQSAERDFLQVLAWDEGNAKAAAGLAAAQRK